MTFFVEENERTSDEVLVNAFYLEDDRVVYGGRELVMQGKTITYYFLPTGEHEAVMFLYLHDNAFDDFVDSIDDYNIDRYNNAFPLFMKALKNGLDENLSRAALLRLPHIGRPGEKFWCLATMVENVDLDDLDTDYVIGKLSNLYSYAIDMANQVDDNDVSLWDTLKGEGRRAARSFGIARGIKAALTFGGALLGFDFSGDA